MSQKLQLHYNTVQDRCLNSPDLNESEYNHKKIYK